MTEYMQNFNKARNPDTRYQELDLMVEDLKANLKFYPGAEARVYDDPPNKLTGFEVSYTDDDRIIFWYYLIHVDDLRNHPSKYQPAMMTDINDRLKFIEHLVGKDRA